MTASPLEGDSRRRVLLAAAIFLVAAAAIALTARDPGLTWDEPIYYGRALRCAEWFEHLSAPAFTEPAIRHYWWWNVESDPAAPARLDHPPLGCLWIALNIHLFGGTVDVITAARLGAAMLFGAAVATLFLWIARKRDVRTGFVAAVAFALMPRLFAHAHFANLEMATVLLWLLTVIAFERGIESRSWSVACGVFFGLALLTKINAVFLPVVLLPWGFLFHGRKAQRNALAMAICGPLIFCAGWPVMWVHPVDAVRAYLHDKTHRPLLPVYYLGKAYGDFPVKRPDLIAPWHYPFVMFLATTPILILAAAAGGVWRHVRSLRAKWKENSHEALVIWAFLFPVCLLALPGIPKYDGVRLMLPAYPFLAALAAAGAIAAWDFSCPRLKRPRATVLAAICAAWLLLPVAVFHPYQLCYYSELAGGPWGAKRLGFETTYWDDTFDAKALEYLNAHAPEKSKVAFVAVGDYIWRNFYQGLGEAREDFLDGDFARNDWDYLVVVPRQGWWTDAEREFVASHQPVWVNTLPPMGRLPICMIYKRTTMDDRP